MKSYDVVGYTYDADIHCPKCAAKRFSQKALDGDTDSETDNDGNTPKPIFADQADDESCGDCGKSLIGNGGHWYTR